MAPDAPARTPKRLPDHLMTTDQLCQYLQVSKRTVASWRAQHTGPAYMRPGNAVRYHPADVEAWLGRSVVTPLRAA